MSIHTSTSVIICTCNRPKDLVTTLDTIAKQTEQPDEIIIVDSSDISVQNYDTFTKVFNEATFKNTKLIYDHTTTKSSTFQRNEGIKCASTDILHFLDDDVILEKDYLAQMNKKFHDYPTYAGGMGSVTNIPKKRLNALYLLRRVFLLQRIHASGNFTLSGFPTHPYGKRTFLTVEALGGCCMSYRSNALKKHRFDEKLTQYAYMEDCDLSYRVSREAPLFYNPTARMKHMQSPENRKKAVDIKAVLMQNYIYLFFKNFYPKNKLKIIPFCWSIFGLFLEALIFRRFDIIKGYIKGIKAPLK